MGSTLQQTVKVIRIDGILLPVKREVKILAHIKGDERLHVLSGWEDPLVAGENDHPVEIKRPCLQHPHDLQSLQGLSVEGQHRGIQQLLQKLRQAVPSQKIP